MNIKDINDIDTIDDLNINTKRVFKYIYSMTHSCCLYDKSGNGINITPVVLTGQDIADKLNLCERTVQRCLVLLIKSKYIYKYSLGSINIYSTEPFINKDLLVRVKLS